MVAIPGHPGGGHEKIGDKRAQAIFLDETGDWAAVYFQNGRIKNNRRLMLFNMGSPGWAEKAAAGGKGSKTPAAKKKAAKKKKR